MVAPEIEGETTTLFLQPEGLDEDETAQYARNRMTPLAALLGAGRAAGAAGAGVGFAPEVRVRPARDAQEARGLGRGGAPGRVRAQGRPGRSINRGIRMTEEREKAPPPPRGGEGDRREGFEGRRRFGRRRCGHRGRRRRRRRGRADAWGVGKKRPREEDREKPTQAGKTKTKSARRG